MTKPLSPAAAAVLKEFEDSWDADPFEMDARALAAALRAAADQVVPLDYEDVWTDGRMQQYEKSDPVREKLLAIAAELEGE
jgi:acetyl-CoA acetyltransferase